MHSAYFGLPIRVEPMQAEELVPKAELRLKEFEAAMGLTRVRATGRGVLSMTARPKTDPKPRPVPKRKSTAASAAPGTPAAYL